MAATVTIRRWTGASGSPTKSDITSTTNRASTSDTNAPGTNNPIPIPASGTKYSFWVSTRLSVDATPSGTINNIKWYSDGGNGFGTGVTCKTGFSTSYVQATGTTGDTGNILNNTNHTGLLDMIAGTVRHNATGHSGNIYTLDTFHFTSSHTADLQGTMSNPSTGDLGDFVVYQMEVTTTASPGTTPSETFTFKYDET